MNNAARNIWKSPEGRSLFAAIFDRQPLTPQQQETLDALKRADPPMLDKHPAKQPTYTGPNRRAVPREVGGAGLRQSESQCDSGQQLELDFGESDPQRSGGSRIADRNAKGRPVSGVCHRNRRQTPGR